MFFLIKQNLLAFPGLGLCRSFCTVIRSSVFTACSNSWSFPIVIYFTSKASSECVCSVARRAPLRILPLVMELQSAMMMRMRMHTGGRMLEYYRAGAAGSCEPQMFVFRCLEGNLSTTVTDLRLTHRWWIGPSVCVAMAKTEQSVLENHHQINQLQSRFGGVSGSDAMHLKMQNQCFFKSPRAVFPGIREAVLETHQSAVPSLRSTRTVIFCAAMGLHKERAMCISPASDWADIAVVNGSASSRGRSQSVGTPPYSSADSHMRLRAHVFFITHADENSLVL